MTYEITSAKTLLRRLQQRLKPSNANWFSEAHEYIGEALELIGAPAHTMRRTCIIKVENFRAPLPCDMFYYNIVGVNPSNPSEKPTAETGVAPLELDSGYMNHSLCSEGCINLSATNRWKYHINAGCIETNFESGYVCLNYQAFSTDEDGLPMIPKDESSNQALFWYSAWQMTLDGSEHRSKQLTPDYCEQRWLKYCTQARTAAAMPDVPQMENFLNQWVRLIPQNTRFDESFADLNLRENLYRDNHYLDSRFPASDIVTPESNLGTV